MSEAAFSELALSVLVPALMLFMGFIVWDLGRKHNAGKIGYAVLFLVLGLGCTGYVAKLIIQASMSV